MKTEPLKDKYKEYAHDLWGDLITKERLGQEATEIFTDIKSAVEWFIQNLREDVNKSGATMLIKEAFQDVIKK